MPGPDSPIDIEALLAPISEASPSGRSIVHEEPYDRIKKARQEDDTSLPQGVWKSRLKTADWSAVAALAAEAIENKSKDLKLACWLAEAWVKLRGFEGAAAGIELVAGLCDRYWDNLYPELDEEGPAPRIALLDWLDRTLEENLALVPFIGTDDGARQAFRLADWHGSTSARGRAAADGAVSTESFLAAASLMGQARWAEIHDGMVIGLQAIGAVDAAVSARVADAPASLHRTRRVLETILGLAQQALGTEAGGAGESPEDGDGPAFPSGRPPHGGSPRGAISSRGEAYALLDEAADYLLRTEPHSPAPYLVKRAVAWGNLSLGELLHELVAGQNDLDAIKKLLGMRK